MLRGIDQNCGFAALLNIKAYILFCHFTFLHKGNHIRQDSMEPGDLWDDVSNCRCGDRLKTLEQRAQKQHQRCLAHSLVGTPNYIAPEVLLRKGMQPTPFSAHFCNSTCILITCLYLPKPVSLMVSLAMRLHHLPSDLEGPLLPYD